MNENLGEIPNKNRLKFGSYTLNEDYRKAMYNFSKIYTNEEIVGTYLGYNPYFPDENTWFLQQDEEDEEDEEEEKEDEEEDE
eukprot:Pgem_evm2s12838